MSAPDCRKIREGLSAYLEGDLDPAETSAIRAHLERCADCRAELELQRLTIGALRCLPDLPPPAGILAGVRARLEPPEPWYRRLAGGRRWLLGVPVGAVATALVVIGVSLFQSRFTETEKMGAPAPLPTYPQPAATAVPTAPQVPTAPAGRTAPPVPAAPVTPFAAVAPERKADRLEAPVSAPAPTPSAGGDLTARLAPIAEAPRRAAVADQVAAPVAPVAPAAPAAPAARPAPAMPTEPAAAPAPAEPMALGKVESRVDKPLPPAAKFADDSAKDANEQFQRQKMVAAAPSLEAAAPEPQAAATGALSLDDRVAQQPERALVPRDRDFAAREESDAKARAVPAPQLMKKEAAAKSARVAERSDEFRSTAIGGERSTISETIRVVCLLLPDGGTVDEIKRLLERAGAGEVKLEALAPSTVREAFAQHRGKPGFPREAAGGWDVTARVQARRLTVLLEELAARPGLVILEKPAALPAAADPTEMLDLRFMVLY